MPCCAFCGGKFGLVRQEYARKQFCGKACVASYKSARKRAVDTRLRQWWNHLCAQSSQRESPERGIR
jgi:hypothetical protein